MGARDWDDYDDGTCDRCKGSGFSDQGLLGTKICPRCGGTGTRN